MSTTYVVSSKGWMPVESHISLHLRFGRRLVKRPLMPTPPYLPCLDVGFSMSRRSGRILHANRTLFGALSMLLSFSEIALLDRNNIPIGCSLSPSSNAPFSSRLLKQNVINSGGISRSGIQIMKSRFMCSPSVVLAAHLCVCIVQDLLSRTSRPPHGLSDYGPRMASYRGYYGAVRAALGILVLGDGTVLRASRMSR